MYKRHMHVHMYKQAASFRIVLKKKKKKKRADPPLRIFFNVVNKWLNKT